MRRDVALNARATDTILDVQPKRDCRERRAALRQKNIRRRFWRDKFWPRNFDETIQSLNGFFPDRHDAFLVAFADDVDESGFEMNCSSRRFFNSDKRKPEA